MLSRDRPGDTAQKMGQPSGKSKRNPVCVPITLGGLRVEPPLSSACLNSAIPDNRKYDWAAETCQVERVALAIRDQRGGPG